MKVLLAVHHFPPRYSAGAELYTFRLARWLIAHGHQAEVVCIETLDEARPAGVEAIQDSYEEVPVWRLHLGLRKAPSDWSYANPMVAAWVKDYLKVWQPDLLHLQSGYLIGAGVLEAAHQCGVPSIVTLHDYWFLCPRITLLRSDGKVCTTPPTDPAECAWCLQQDQRRYRLPEQLSGGAAGRTWIALNGEAGRHEQAARRAYLRKALGLANLAIAPSQFLASMFRDLVEPAQLQVVRLGINTKDLDSTPPPQGNPLHLAYIGQIAPHKGVHLIIEALRLLPHGERTIQLQIYGNLDQHPTYTQRLRNLIGKDARITLAGRFANGRIAEVLA
ncbi:MAG: glycosyl transferase family 1, partial [Chloroflexia bacterium]|nr:glycosyl transferase family 1 [Chloroflexia bacterium]